MKQHLYASDYGVIGDGITDDGPAISQAVRDAVSRQAELIFDGNKTYYVGTALNTAAIFTAPFAFEGASGVTIDGQGATFKTAPGINYFAMVNCTDIALVNCTFDYAVPVYLVGKVTAAEGDTVFFDTDLEPYVDSFDYSKYVAFSILYNEGLQRRPHRFLTAMEKTGSKRVKAVYQGDPGYRVGDVVYLPNPGIGHVYSEVIYVEGCHGTMTFENIKVRSVPSFTFVIRSCDAEIYLDRIDFLPDEKNDREIQMVAWRDGYHIKDNRGPIHWKNCKVGVLFDDVYNVSNTLGLVTDFTEDGKPITVNYEYTFMNRVIPFDCRTGDVLDFYDLEAGSYHGRAVVAEAEYTEQGVILTFDESKTDLSGVTEGCLIGNHMTCAPGSTITDCEFEGTFRFLRDIRIENTVFDLLEMWLMVEGSVEGPLPGNVEFVNCTFRRGQIQVDAYNRNTRRYMPDIGKEIHGIRARGCRFAEGARTTGQTGGALEIVSGD